MTDFWNQCFDPKMGLTPNDFERTWCKICRNQDCSRSRGSGTAWLQRISTQVDRLLLNPKFADKEDPKYRDLRAVDFPSALQEAMRLEVSDRKRDWTVPTDTDVTQMAEEMTIRVTQAPKSTPKHFEEPVVTLRHPATPSDTPKVLHTFSIRGTKGDDYAVTLVEGDQGPEWRCTCLAWVHGRTRPCKHIEYAVGLLEEEEEQAPVEALQAPPEPKVAVTPPQRFQPSPVPARAPFYPPLGNVPLPQGGVMVDGSAPPPRTRPAAQEEDPWAPPPPKPIVVPVGGKVVLGGGRK